MKKLLVPNYHALLLAAHYEFFADVDARMAATGEAFQAAVAALLPGYRARLAEEEAVLRWTRKSELTEQIVKADAEIERVMVAMNGVVQTGRHSAMPAIKASGDKVYHKLQEYGPITRKPYTEQAGDLRALLKDFAGSYAQDVANLGMAMWVQFLQAAFDTFVSLIAQRDNEQVEKPACTAKQARKAMEGAWRPLADTINVNALAGVSPEFAAFIERLNPEIARINAEVHPTKKDLSVAGRVVFAEIDTLFYTGKPITVIPKVYYRVEGEEAVELALGKHFSVTFKNNTEVGTATVIIHGKGDYTGQASTTFNIVRAK
jgi:hypothetical protein